MNATAVGAVIGRILGLDIPYVYLSVSLLLTSVTACCMSCNADLKQQINGLLCLWHVNTVAVQGYSANRSMAVLVQITSQQHQHSW